jgi:uncharacterized protein
VAQIVTRPAKTDSAGQLGFRFESSGVETYPEPVEHCNVCRWFKECDTRRRQDDHLSLVAGMRTQQREQLVEWKVSTLAELAKMPVPLQHKPRYGSRDGYERVRDQARVQVQGRAENKPVHEAILPVSEGMGFCRLPEPNRLDAFVDLEGDPFAGTQGQQYLFGLSARGTDGKLVYQKRWSLTAKEEKSGFEWLMDEIVRRWAEEPGMHVYHYGANEPGAFKRLMGQYATREEEMDRMLRGGKFVDLHRVVKQGVRASVEEYSLKSWRHFTGSNGRPHCMLRGRPCDTSSITWSWDGRVRRCGTICARRWRVITGRIASLRRRCGIGWRRSGRS